MTDDNEQPAAPASPNEPAPEAKTPSQGELDAVQLRSINEPPGSSVETPPPEVEPPDEGIMAIVMTDDDPLPSDDELMAMTRAQLDQLAEARGVDIAGCTNKAQVIERLQEDADA